MISRMVKMTALLAAPYDHALFLDSDTFVCKPWTELLEHVRLGGFMRAFDFALAQNHIDSTSLPPKALWDHYGVPQAFAELNSGVIFFRPHSPGVQSVLTDWLDLYLSEDYIQRTTRKPNRRGRGEGAGDQIALTISLYHALEARRVSLYTLGGHWNFLNFRRDFVHPLTDDCCSHTRDRRGDIPVHPIEIIIDHDCVWNGERRDDEPQDGRNVVFGTSHLPHRHHEPGDRHGWGGNHGAAEPGSNALHPGMHRGGGARFEGAASGPTAEQRREMQVRVSPKPDPNPNPNPNPNPKPDPNPNPHPNPDPNLSSAAKRTRASGRSSATRPRTRCRATARRTEAARAREPYLFYFLA